jgi:rhodanese-related sulfurtransferase
VCERSQAVAGGVREVEAKEWRALESAGWVLLDVRRAEEVSRAAVKSSVCVPLFEVDDDRSLFGLLKQWADLGTGGWWHGTAHTKANANFLPEVQAAVPTAAPGMLVACQTGMRSLAASDQLHRAGYTNVAWCVRMRISLHAATCQGCCAALANTTFCGRLEGGFDKSTKADFDTTNGKSMRFGGVGGLAGAMGWTKVQEQEEPGAQFAGGPMRVIAFIAVLAALDYAWIGACAAACPVRVPATGRSAARLPGACSTLRRNYRAAGYDYFLGTGK